MILLFMDDLKLGLCFRVAARIIVVTSVASCVVEILLSCCMLYCKCYNSSMIFIYIYIADDKVM